ncbi:MAG: GNAT family protein [Pseudomonadota bacterium]
MQRKGGEDRPVGPPVAGWTPVAEPRGVVREGHWARIEPLDPARHAADLFAAFDGHDAIWDYIAWGPYRALSAFHKALGDLCATPGWSYCAIIDRSTDRAVGKAAWMNITPEHGVIEVGGIVISPALQRTPAATEAMVLMMDWALEAGYRRYEWKCDALNAPSRAAAQRLGLGFEGVFRNHLVVKGRSRDTAWFAATDADWPALRAAFDIWLAPENFDETGRQRERLSSLTALTGRTPDTGAFGAPRQGDPRAAMVERAR